VRGVSQDGESETRELARQMGVAFPLEIDRGFELSRRFDLVTVPTLFVLDEDGRVTRSEAGFDKQSLNEIATMFGRSPVASAYDGNPASKPGCMSRHLETQADGASAPALDAFASSGPAASRIDLADGEDSYEYCYRVFGDALPVVPPTVERVERMLGAAAHDPRQVIGRVPPCYGEATVEKIAANAVMAGCLPEMMPVLVPLVRAVCDERFNAHGVQATTHFAVKTHSAMSREPTARSAAHFS